MMTNWTSAIAIQRLAAELDISEEHARDFIQAITTWQSRVGQRVRFEYVSLKKNRSMLDGRVTSITIFGAERELAATLPILEGGSIVEEQSVVAKIDGKGNYRVWPEDRISNMEVMPLVHPCAVLVNDIDFTRCGKEGEIRLKSRNGCFLRKSSCAWAFDMEAFSLLYVFPSEPAEVARMCPRAFPSLNKAELHYSRPRACEEPEPEEACG